MRNTIDELRSLGFTVEKANNFTSNPMYTKKINASQMINLNEKADDHLYTYKDKIGICHEQLMQNILNADNKRILIIGDAGGGKTFATIKGTDIRVRTEIINGEKIAYVLIVPNKNQAKQNETNRDLVTFNTQAVVGKDNKKDEAIKLDLERRKYSAVYDKTKEVIVELKEAGFKTVLIIDEAHKLLSDFSFRFKAISEVDECIDINSEFSADKVVMMTATPGNLQYYYQFSDVITFQKSEKFVNIEELKIVATKDIKKCIIKHAKNIVEEQGIKGRMRPLVKVNHLEKAKEYKSTLEAIKLEDGNNKYLVKILESDKKSTDAFKLIENDGILERGLSGKDLEAYLSDAKKRGVKNPIVPEREIILCTSLIEVGLSLKDEFIPVEAILSTTKYNENNTVQYFARPRHKVPYGILIYKNNVNGIASDEDFQAYINREKHFNNVPRVEIKDETDYIKKACEEANVGCKQYQILMDNQIKLYGREAGIEFFNAMYVADKVNGRVFPFELDADNMNIMINKKRVLNRAESNRFRDIITKAPELLRTCFENKIFYDKITFVYDNLSEKDRELKAIMKENKDIVKKMNEEKIVRETEIRELLESKEIIKSLKLISADKVDEENFSGYKFKKHTFEDINKIKESTIMDLIETGLKVFDKTKEVVDVINYKMNDDYITKKMAWDAIESKGYINLNKNRVIDIESKRKDDIIINTLTDNGQKHGKKINLTEDKVFKLGVVLIDEKYLKGSYEDIESIINDLKVKERYTCSELDENGKLIKFRAFDDENIKKLEGSISSDKRIRILNKAMCEISKVYEIKTDKGKYYYVNSPIKKFDMDKFAESQNVKYFK